MKKIAFFFLASCSAFITTAQENFVPRSNMINYKLGDGLARIQVIQYGQKKDLVFINLHSDETTSVAGAEKILKKRGGLLIKLENDEQRNIRFRLDNNFYTFDPNRIFSRIGIEKTLTRFNNISDNAVNEVEKFANHLLSLLPVEAYCVIALHNNTHGNLSVNSFLPGNEYEKDAKKVYVGKDQDPDDFFLTTDSLFFHGLSAEKYNRVWQDNQNVQQDGSLSVYFGEKNTCYINCETEHGKVTQYEKMLIAALNYLEERKRKLQAAIH